METTKFLPEASEKTKGICNTERACAHCFSGKESCLLTDKIIGNLSIAGVVLGSLPSLPGYNGSILMIDDDEASNIVDSINKAVAFLKATG